MSRRPALFLNVYLADRRVLVVGSGAGSDERAERIQAAGASLIRLTEDQWQADQANVGTVFAVIANSESDGLNAEVARWAREKGYLAYAHDQPDLSDFAFPALCRRGFLQLAISTDGVAPALAGQLRRQLNALLASGGTKLDAIMLQLAEVREKFPPGPDRMQILKGLASRVRLVGTCQTQDEE